MQTVTVPLCYLPNSKHQVFNMATCKRSAFQVARLAQIAALPEFAYFVTIGDDVMTAEFSGPASIMWYGKNGACHALRIGVSRVLSERTFAASNPVPRDHVVYTSRCR